MKVKTGRKKAVNRAEANRIKTPRECRFRPDADQVMIWLKGILKEPQMHVKTIGDRCELRSMGVACEDS
jgi:hypothetical protein